jgi:hypothetical protein
LNKPVDLAISKPNGGNSDVDLLGLDLIGDVSKTTTNSGSFDPFYSKNQAESNIIFIERPKSQQQQQIIVPSQNSNFIQSTPSIPSSTPELLDIFSSPIQPQATQNR